MPIHVTSPCEWSGGTVVDPPPRTAWRAESSVDVRSLAVLSDRSRPVIQATLPVVAQAIPRIAPRSYQHMFTAHPELLDGIFNRGNQAEGSQQAALAGSVATFAGALVKTPEQLPDHLLPNRT